jgi:circadian clock protein KaiC
MSVSIVPKSKKPEDMIFVRLDDAIDSIGAKRGVLDSIETLFGSLSNRVSLRSELNRLFQWL